MNKISIFVLLILIYLGISKSFSPSEKKTPFLANERVFNNFFRGSPLSVILLGSFPSGFMIKTYHHKYRIIRAFTEPEEITVRVSKKFWLSNLKNHSMSLFRRQERTEKTSTIPMPPGTLFVGDPAYGTWEPTDYGSKYWKFHRTYKNFPEIFNWGKFQLDLTFYKKLKIYQSNEQAFYGLNKEFGTRGTSQPTASTNEIKEKTTSELKKLFKKYLWIPAWDKIDE